MIEQMIDAVFRAAVYAEEIGQRGSFITQRFVDIAVENMIPQNKNHFAIGFVC